jgi:Domain of unknown function (DUF5916)/Carbohydrate family 9 binding domain-like
MPLRLVLLAMCLSLIPRVSTTANAQISAGIVEPDVPEKIGKNLQALRVDAGGAPRIDGRLDDQAWVKADRIDDFVQVEPDNMSRPTERTVVQVAYDSRYLYVAVRCEAADASKIRSGLGRRDNLPDSDRIYLAFDPRHDHQTGYVYEVNTSGVQGDSTLYDDTNTSSDYDGVWEAATQIDSRGWSVEVRIPFSQMRFDAGDADAATWGLNVSRHTVGTGEESRWVPLPRGAIGNVSRFGHLIFGERLTPPRRIEFLPYTMTSVERHATDSDHTGFNGGADIRLGLGAATLSATINPDFGQVEADPAVLNLSVFETFFPEKRPFFLEDSRIFVLPYGQAPDFYSRRIGAAPGRLKRDGEKIVERPDQTTILGAAKITGKSSGWTYGALGAVTAREYGVVDVTTTEGDGTETVTRRNRQLLEPATFYSVGRLQRDVRGSNVGFVTTAVVREKDLDAFTGGPDYNVRWSRNRFNTNGHWIVTHAPIDGRMRTDHGGLVNFSFEAKHFGLFAHADRFGKDFRNTDLGFLGSRTNKKDVSLTISATQPDPWTIFRSISWHAGGFRDWNGDGLVFGNAIYSGINVNFKNYWFMHGGFTHHFTKFDDLDTRGGPPILRLPSNSFYMGVWSDSRKKVRAGLFTWSNVDADGGWARGVEPEIRVQVSDRLQANVSVNYLAGRDTAQWIKNEDLNADTTEEHIYGRLKRNVVNITGRATYSFARDLTLEAYLQPFVAAGDYTDIRRLALPRSFTFDPVAIPDNPDFNNKSLRGTIVMRWEYLRGSTLFLVWNMATSDESRKGEFSALRDLGTGFGAPGSHVFVAKLSYWFTP